MYFGNSLKTSVMLLALSVVLVAGFSVAGAEQVVIQYAFWGAGVNLEIEREIVAAFEAANPDIKVELLPGAGAGAGAYEEKLVTLHAAGHAPDVMRLDSFYFADFASQNLIRPVDDLIEASGIDLDEYFPIALVDAMYDGRMYGLPWGSYPRLLFYNQDNFDMNGLVYPSLDWDWETYVDTARKLTRTDGNDVVVYGTEVPTQAQWILPTVWAFGGSMFDETRSTFTLNSPQAAEALQRNADLINEYRAATPETSFWDVRFSNGKVSMVTGFLQEGMLLKQNNLGFNWDAHVEPGGPAGQYSLWKGNVLAISSQSQHPEAAWRFIEFLVGPTSPGMEIYLKHKRIAPQSPHGELWRIYADPTEDPKSLALMVQYIAMNTARPLPVREGYQRIRQVLDNAWLQVRSGELPAQQAMEQIAPVVQAILDETR